MLKSNFTRNLIAFVLLSALSFTAITVITSFIVIESTRSDRIETSKRIADAVYEELDQGLQDYNDSFTSAILRIQNQITYADRFAAVLNSHIFITDKNGFVLYSSSPEYRSVSRIRSDIVQSNTAYSGETHCNTLGGIFEKKYFVTAYPIYDNPSGKTAVPDGDIYGILFICSPAAGVFETVKSIVALIIIALVWVFFAAFIALYFISERLNVPLAQLKHKFAEFSDGDYTVRMPSTGVTEVDLIGDAFNEMAATLERNENSRRTFLCNISHDLRTPMTSIQGFMEAITDGTLPPHKHRYYLLLIYKEIKRLSGMVNELLDVSRVEAGTLRLNKSVFDFCEMVRLIIISLEERLVAKNIDFKLIAVNYHSFVLADKDSIYQAVYNLLDNATKFAEENGKIRVTVIPDVPEETPAANASPSDELQTSPANEDSEAKEPEEPVLKYHISVYNTGSGISDEQKKKIFERFYKADTSRGKNRNGLGLGLFIVKTVMELHEEPIDIQSKENEFCEFLFTLPLVSNPGKADSFGMADLPPNVMPPNIHLGSPEESEEADEQEEADKPESVKTAESEKNADSPEKTPSDRPDDAKNISQNAQNAKE